jgi:hypothetical protein
MGDFDQLLDEALGVWPPRLNLRIRRLRGGRSIVIGLMDLHDRVRQSAGCESWLHQHMHWAIASAVMATAKTWPDHYMVMAPAKLDRSRIRVKFESDLASIVAATDNHGFSPEDVQSFKDYLFTKGRSGA